MGLLAILRVDISTTLAAWGEYDRFETRDPLVEAAMGQLHLGRGDPQRAYPRLRAACDAFPGVGFLHVSLADAAIQCGDTDIAEAILERASKMERLDQTVGLERVWADLYAATGRDAQAIAIWDARDGQTTTVMKYRYGRYLEAHGDLAGAVRAYGFAGSGSQGGYRAAWDGFQRVAGPWWASLALTERWRLLRHALDEPESAEGRVSFVHILTAYAKWVLEPAIESAAANGTEQDPLIAKVKTPGSLEAAALAVRAIWRLGRAHPAAAYAPWLKGLQAFVWLSPWPIQGSLALRALDEVARGLNLPSWNHR